MRDDLDEQSIFGRLASALEDAWATKARPEQLPPPGDDWTTWLILAGRGFGKTRTGAEWVRSLAEAASVHRIALVGPTASDVRDTMVEGESGLLSICPNWNHPIYEPSKRRLTWPNGVIATMFSSEEPERLRGPQHGAAWCDELAAWNNVDMTWSMLQFGLRLGARPRQAITTTPKPIKILKELVKNEDGSAVITRGSTYQNRANLAPSFFSQIVKRYEGTRLGRQELNAEILEDIPGALWSRDLIEDGRRAKGSYDNFKRIVVAIDPAISNHEDSDETGIIVAGLGYDDEGYILEDLSGKYTPTEWASKAVVAYHRWRADRIVAESNQGGAMVENIVRVVDPRVSLKLVHASRGKIVRAEPVSALYEQGRVHHLGMFAELENQLCCFAPGSTDSPDRLDALVYALTELMVPAWAAQALNFHVPLVCSRPRMNGLPVSGVDGVQTERPGGWAAGSIQAAASAPFATLGWSIKK
jgi:phage terminase large subunit-like protein